MKQTIEIEDGVVPAGYVIDRIGWPKKGEHYLFNRISNTANSDHRASGLNPSLVLRQVWTAPDWFLADRIRKQNGKLQWGEGVNGSNWYSLSGSIKTEALNLPANWDGSPMRCRPEVGTTQPNPTGEIKMSNPKSTSGYRRGSIS